MFDRQSTEDASRRSRYCHSDEYHDIYHKGDAMCSVEVPIENFLNEKATMIVGFEKEQEFLAKLDVFDKIASQRKLFFIFFNNQIDDDLRFSNREITQWVNVPLQEAFVMKIKLLFGWRFAPLVYEMPSDLSIFKPFSSSIQQLFSRPKYFQASLGIPLRRNVKRAEKLFMLIDENRLSFLLNAQYAFEEFVIDRLGKVHKEEEIVQFKEYIDVVVNEDEKVKIFPFWQMLRPDKCAIDEHIQKAVECIEQTSFKQVYLVYPKNKMFKKHIPIKVPHLDLLGEYRIKIVPYSMRSILK